MQQFKLPQSLLVMYKMCIFTTAKEKHYTRAVFLYSQNFKKSLVMIELLRKVTAIKKVLLSLI
jgi:hypothetical protein